MKKAVFLLLNCFSILLTASNVLADWANINTASHKLNPDACDYRLKHVQSIPGGSYQVTQYFPASQLQTTPDSQVGELIFTVPLVTTNDIANNSDNFEYANHAENVKKLFTNNINPPIGLGSDYQLVVPSDSIIRQSISPYFQGTFLEVHTFLKNNNGSGGSHDLFTRFSLKSSKFQVQAKCEKRRAPLPMPISLNK